MYRADGKSLTLITDLVPVEWLPYGLRPIELIFTATILEHANNKERQLDLGQFLRGKGVRVKMPVAGKGKAAPPKALRINFNGDNCDKLRSMYKELVSKYGPREEEKKKAALQVWRYACEMADCVGAGTVMADTPENRRVQVAAFSTIRDNMYTSLAGIVGIDIVNQSWYSHGSVHMLDSYKAFGPDAIQHSNEGVEHLNKLRKMAAHQHSSLKADDRAAAGLRSEVLKNAVMERNAGLRRARELHEKENQREQARKRQKLDDKENVPPAAGAGSSR